MGRPRRLSFRRALPHLAPAPGLTSEVPPMEIDQLTEISPIPGLTWEDLDKIGDALTKLPLDDHGKKLARRDVGVILAWLLSIGYTILPVGKP
jgi:hypothetical protein